MWLTIDFPLQYILIPRKITDLIKDIYEEERVIPKRNFVKLLKLFCIVLSVADDKNLYYRVPAYLVEGKSLSTYRYRGKNMLKFLEKRPSLQKALNKYFLIDYARGHYLISLIADRIDFFKEGYYKVPIAEFEKAVDFYDFIKLFTISKYDVLGVFKKIGIKYAKSSIYTIINRINKSSVNFRTFNFSIPTKIYYEVKKTIEKHPDFCNQNISYIAKLICLILYLKVEGRFSFFLLNKKEQKILKTLFTYNAVLFNGHVIFKNNFSIEISSIFIKYWKQQEKMYSLTIGLIRE